MIQKLICSQIDLNDGDITNTDCDNNNIDAVQLMRS